jgi:hypothetical protein
MAAPAEPRLKCADDVEHSVGMGFQRGNEVSRVDQKDLRVLNATALATLSCIEGCDLSRRDRDEGATTSSRQHWHA